MLIERLRALFEGNKRTIRNLFGIAVALEVASFAGSYYFYRKTNRDPEFRFTLATSNYTSGILEAYYRLGEQMNPELKIRERDLELWRSQGKIR